MGGCIRDLVSRLRPEYRAVVVLAELKELTHAEIASVLGLSPGNVKIRLHRARRALLESLEARCRVFLDERGEIQCDRKGGNA